MNAVEAAEQLIRLGRQVQRQEGRLLLPVAPLLLAPVPDRLLADPLAALEDLLAAASGAPPPLAATPRQRGPQRRGPQDASPFAPASQPAAPRQGDAGAERDVPAWRPVPAAPAEPVPGRAPSPGQERAASPGALAGREGTSPAAPVRLAQRQSTLLNILRANVGEAEAPAAGGQAGDRLPPHLLCLGAAQAEAQEAGAQEAGHTPLPPAGGDLPAAGAAAGAPAWGAAPADLPAWATPGAMEIAMLTGWGGGALSPAEAAGSSALPRPAWPLPQEAGAAGAAVGRQVETAAGGGRTVGLPAPAASGAGPEEVWAGAAGAFLDRPLSAAQIEQVLAALDERLELQLLRIYGASAGA